MSVSHCTVAAAQCHFSSLKQYIPSYQVWFHSLVGLPQTKTFNSVQYVHSNKRKKNKLCFEFWLSRTFNAAFKCERTFIRHFHSARHNYTAVTAACLSWAVSYQTKTMFPDTKTLFAASEIHLNYTVYQEMQVHKKMQIVTNKHYTCQLLLPCNLKHNGFTLTVSIIHCNGYRVRNCAEVNKWFCGAGTKPKLPVIF